MKPGEVERMRRSRPMFGISFWRYGVNIVLFRRLFQFRRAVDELYSQRNDPKRIRIFGLSIKLFG